MQRVQFINDPINLFYRFRHLIINPFIMISKHLGRVFKRRRRGREGKRKEKREGKGKGKKGREKENGKKDGFIALQASKLSL